MKAEDLFNIPQTQTDKDSRSIAAHIPLQENSKIPNDHNTEFESNLRKDHVFSPNDQLRIPEQPMFPLEAEAVLSILSGQTDQFDIKSLLHLVSSNDFIKEALSKDLTELWNQSIPLPQLLEKLGINQRDFQSAYPQLFQKETISPKEFFKSIGIDPTRAMAQLSRLKRHLLGHSLHKFLGIASAASESQEIPANESDHFRKPKKTLESEKTSQTMQPKEEINRLQKPLPFAKSQINELSANHHQSSQVPSQNEMEPFSFTSPPINASGKKEEKFHELSDLNPRAAFPKQQLQSISGKPIESLEFSDGQGERLSQDFEVPKPLSSMTATKQDLPTKLDQKLPLQNNFQNKAERESLHIPFAKDISTSSDFPKSMKENDSISNKSMIVPDSPIQSIHAENFKSLKSPRNEFIHHFAKSKMVPDELTNEKKRFSNAQETQTTIVDGMPEIFEEISSPPQTSNFSQSENQNEFTQNNREQAIERLEMLSAQNGTTAQVQFEHDEWGKVKMGVKLENPNTVSVTLKDPSEGLESYLKTQRQDLQEVLAEQNISLQDLRFSHSNSFNQSPYEQYRENPYQNQNQSYGQNMSGIQPRNSSIPTPILSSSVHSRHLNILV